MIQLLNVVVVVVDVVCWEDEGLHEDLEHSMYLSIEELLVE